MMQILYILAVLLLLAFDLDAPRSGAGGGLGLRACS